jgi:hypothetical protein
MPHSNDMTDKFQQMRWSATRQQIHAMKRRAVLTFPPEQYFNCHATVQRLNDAYSGVRRYVLTTKNKHSTITRSK